MCHTKEGGKIATAVQDPPVWPHLFLYFWIFCTNWVETCYICIWNQLMLMKSGKWAWTRPYDSWHLKDHIFRTIAPIFTSCAETLVGTSQGTLILITQYLETSIQIVAKLGNFLCEVKILGLIINWVDQICW